MANYQFENEQRRQRFIKKLENDYNGKLTPVSQLSTAINAPKKAGAPFVETETDVFSPDRKVERYHRFERRADKTAELFPGPRGSGKGTAGIPQILSLTQTSGRRSA